MKFFDVLIVGAGHAGAQVALELVTNGYMGRIGLLSNEHVLPYERPPLTKAFLQGKASSHEILIRPASFWAESGVELILDAEVTRVDAVARTVETSSGETYGYGQLVWAAGGSARKLAMAGEELDGVHALRTLADAEYAKLAMTRGARYVIVGGGFIGLEAAAAFASAGMQVTVLEAQQRLLSRVTGPDASDFFLRLHRKAGVRIELGAQLAAIEGSEGTVTDVRLGDGTVLPADRVLVGVGLIPIVAALRDAGAACSNGVDVDEYGATTLPDVFAVGDCACMPFDLPPSNRLRLESIQNATELAKTVAANLLGQPRPYTPEPWFWSNQYDVKFKTVGISTGYDHTVLRGDPQDGRFSVVYFREGRVIAVDAINSMRDYVGARSIIGHEISPDIIADSSVQLAHVLDLAVEHD